MRYHCATSALLTLLRAWTTLSDALRISQSGYAARQNPSVACLIEQ